MLVSTTPRVTNFDKIIGKRIVFWENFYNFEGTIITSNKNTYE